MEHWEKEMKKAKKKSLYEIRNLVEQGIEFPKETPNFESVRHHIYQFIEDNTPYSSRRPTMQWMPEQTNFGRKPEGEKIYGYFRYTRTISVRLPRELGVDSADIVATYYLDPNKGLESEAVRVIQSINAVEKWSDDTHHKEDIQELAKKVLEEHGNA